MPLRNRVTPFGELIDIPAKGEFMANRGGRIHDPAARALTARRWASRRWICCALRFRNRPKRTVWGPTSYTELFFLDEVTALAAGHRPCFECRRADARAFQDAAAAGLAQARPGADMVDAALHRERLDGRRKRLHSVEAASLPDGAVVRVDGRALAIRGGHALPWSPDGYGAPVTRPLGTVEALSPPTVLAALRSGYRPAWHSKLPASERAPSP